jgi:hypothetical protein
MDVCQTELFGFHSPPNTFLHTNELFIRFLVSARAAAVRELQGTAHAASTGNCMTLKPGNRFDLT